MSCLSLTDSIISLSGLVPALQMKTGGFFRNDLLTELKERYH